MKFIGRKEELKKLDAIINNYKFSFVLIYGRRRVGKSELVKQALENSSSKYIYYECKQVKEQTNTNSLSRVIADVLNLPKLGFDSFEETLDFIFSYSIKEKLILVLDEYPYLKENTDGIDSILQSLIDKYKNGSKLTLIILGSYVDIMKNLLSHSNPLFGRVDLTINLKEMNYFESSLFYPNFSNEDKVKIYSVFGGIPYYNELIDDKIGVRENIINLIASKNARLENEVSTYLTSEISKMSNANEVFDALSKGSYRYSDILNKSHVSSGPTLVDTLEKLMKMEIVGKVSPINDSNNKRKVGYKIIDNLSSFYYRYIFKYSSQMNLMDKNIFFDKYIKDDFESYYVPHKFEEICSQYLKRQNLLGLINPVFDAIGKYYYGDPINHKNGEFDIVTHDDKGYIFYEVKFINGILTENDIFKEIEQVKNTGLNAYKYVFFTKNKNDDYKIENVEFIYLDELFK